MERLKISDYDLLKHFERWEFRYPDLMDAQFLMLLDQARERAGVPFHITSSYRPRDCGSHGAGVAVDIGAEDSHSRFVIVKSLIDVGLRRIGVYERHVHVDMAHWLVPEVLFIGSYGD